jgi:hypothetical protein
LAEKEMPKFKGNRRTKTRQQKLVFLGLGVTLVLFFCIAFGIVWILSSFTRIPDQPTLKAAIIDQLYLNYPNQYITEEITQYLEDYGFQVDIYHGNDVTVDFYRNLAQHGYNLLIIRSHSGAMRHETETDRSSGTYLFTTESYSTTKYPKEQINDEVAITSVESGQLNYFAVGPKFITNSMKGKLNNTVVIIDGCSGLYSSDLAHAFVIKGASAYLAWNASVRLDYADGATLSLIKNLCSGDVKVAKAIDVTMTENGSDPVSNASLKYYPKDIGNLSVRELTKIK